MVHRTKFRQSEIETPFPHRLREHWRDRVVGFPRIPEGHGEECGAVTYPRM